MDWTPAVDAARAEHDRLCAVTQCDWLTCAHTPPVPAVARRMGLLEEHLTLADRAVLTPEPRPDLDATWCVCGQKRRGHSVDGLRCYHCAQCQADGGFRNSTEKLLG